MPKAAEAPLRMGGLTMDLGGVRGPTPPFGRHGVRGSNSRRKRQTAAAVERQAEKEQMAYWWARKRAEYEGGALELQAAGTVVSLRPPAGTMVVFRAQHLLHRVTPVTRGTRRTLVLWAGDPTERERTWQMADHLGST